MITDGARNAPRRTELPPGTMRTLSSTVNRRTGMVSLSMNENCPSDMSANAPRRKPASMVSFIHEFTTHWPSIFSATRILPDSRSAQTSRNRSLVISIIYSNSSFRNTSASNVRVPPVAAISGRRISSRQSPMRESAALTGIGLLSTKHA